MGRSYSYSSLFMDHFYVWLEEKYLMNIEHLRTSGPNNVSVLKLKTSPYV